MVEHKFNMQDALDSIPSVTKKSKEKLAICPVSLCSSPFGVYCVWKVLLIHVFMVEGMGVVLSHW